MSNEGSTGVGIGPTPVPKDPVLEVRRYRPGDEIRIIDLYERTFGRPMGPGGSAPHWLWEFVGNPVGEQAILLAFHEDRLAAQYAALPLRVQLDGQERTGALSLDTATDAAFRGRGLFPKLAKQLYSELASAGSVAVFGFPNVMSAPTFFRKLEWTELAPFPLLVKPLSGALRARVGPKGALWRGLAEIGELGWSMVRRGPARRSDSLLVEEVSVLPEDTDLLWSGARTGKRVCVIRDRRYLKWRYIDHPDTRYRVHTMREAGRLVGLLVTVAQARFSLRCGFVMELLCEESRDDVARALVSLAESTLTISDCQILAALGYPGNEVRRALESAGFFMPPARLAPQEIHFGVRPFVTGPDRATLVDPRNWYVTWGDSDVV